MSYKYNILGNPSKVRIHGIPNSSNPSEYLSKVSENPEILGGAIEEIDIVHNSLPDYVRHSTLFGLPNTYSILPDVNSTKNEIPESLDLLEDDIATKIIYTNGPNAANKRVTSQIRLSNALIVSVIIPQGIQGIASLVDDKGRIMAISLTYEDTDSRVGIENISPKINAFSRANRVVRFVLNIENKAKAIPGWFLYIDKGLLEVVSRLGNTNNIPTNYSRAYQINRSNGLFHNKKSNSFSLLGTRYTEYEEPK